MKIKLAHEGVSFIVKILPKASKTQIVGWENETLKIRIAAPPEKGKANSCLIAFLSTLLNIAKSRILIVKGEKSPLKTILLLGESIEEVQKKLNV